MNLPRIQPINPRRIATPFDHPDWLFELKHDGYRAVVYIDNGKCELVSRKQNVYKRFGPLAAAFASAGHLHGGGTGHVVQDSKSWLHPKGRSARTV